MISTAYLSYVRGNGKRIENVLSLESITCQPGRGDHQHIDKVVIQNRVLSLKAWMTLVGELTHHLGYLLLEPRSHTNMAFLRCSGLG